MIAHKIFKVIVVIMLVVLLISTSVMSAFASPSLEDATIAYSVKGYSTQYSVEPAYTRNVYVTSDGVEHSTTTYCSVTDYFVVEPGTYLFLYYPSNFTFIVINYCCFYDSEHNVVSGGFDGNFVSNTKDSILVPPGAFYARISHAYGMRACVVSSLFEVTSSNYEHVFHEINDITFTDGLITIPYQTSSYTSVFLDFEFYPNNYYAQAFTLDVFSYLTASYFDGKYVLDYLDGTYLTLYRYFDDSSGVTQYEFLDDTVNNPASFSEAFNNRVPFRGFRLYIPISYNGYPASVSSNLTVELSNFMLDSHSTQMVQEIKSIQERLSDYSLEHLTDVDLSNLYGYTGDASDTVENVRFRTILDTVYGYGIIPTLMILSIAVGFVGYLMFGKSG